MSQLVSVSSPASGREMLERYASASSRLRGPMRRQERVRVAPLVAPLVATPPEPLLAAVSIEETTNELDRIVMAVARKHGLTVSELLSERKSLAVLPARQEAMWRCLVETNEPLAAISLALNRNAKTVAEGALRFSERTGAPVPRMLASWRSIGRGRRHAKTTPPDHCPMIGEAIRARLQA